MKKRIKNTAATDADVSPLPILPPIVLGACFGGIARESGLALGLWWRKFSVKWLL
jgi:hypothetical protein